MNNKIFYLLPFFMSMSCYKNSDAKDSTAVEKNEQVKQSADKTSGEGKNKERSERANGRGSGPVSVRVNTTEKKIVARSIVVLAPLQGRNQADVYSKVIGRLSWMGPTEGSPVRAGQILFKVDRSDPGESFLSAPVSSPIEGWIGFWHVTNVGERVTTTDPVVTVIDDRILKATAFIPHSDWTFVTQQTKVFASYGESMREAKIESISRAADLSSGRGAVTVAIVNPKQEWRVGGYVSLRFEIAPQERMIVSASSLIITDQGAYVYCVKNNMAERISVKFKIFDNDTVEIIQGIEPQMKLVVAGANLLGDKSPVMIVE